MISKTATIDTSNDKDVNNYVKDVFKELTKKKTRYLLTTFYDWLQKDPARQCEGTPLIELDASFQRKRAKQNVLVFNDKYSALLLRIFKKYRMYKDELLKVFANIRDLNVSIDGIYTFGPVLSRRDNTLLKHAFIVICKTHAHVKVLQPIKKTNAKKKKGKAHEHEEKVSCEEPSIFDDDIGLRSEIFRDAEQPEENENSQEEIQNKNVNLVCGISVPLSNTSDRKHTISKSLIEDLESTLSNLSISVEIKNCKK